MAEKLKLIKAEPENDDLACRKSLSATELQHFKNVTGNVVQDALKVWAELWGELEGRVVSGIVVLPEAKKRFEPSCGWSEFLEKMWVLKHYLNFIKRFSQQ
jgi:hypothetical protein